LAADYPNEPEYVAAKIDIQCKLGTSLARRARPLEAEDSAMLLAEAELYHRSAVAIGSWLTDGFPDVTSYTVWYAISRTSLASVLSQGRQFDEADALLASTIADLRAELKADPSLRAIRGSLIHCYVTQFFVLSAKEQFDLALVAMEKAQDLRGRPSWSGASPGGPPFGLKTPSRKDPNYQRGNE
jgi:hypothetical protein